MLILKSSVTEKSNSKSIFLYDKTGIYNNPLNLGGYTSPNPDPTATSAVLKIYFPDATTLLPQTTYTQIDVSADLPNVNNVPYEVTAASQGLTTFADGWYMFTYELVISGITYTSKTQKIFRNLVCCCSKEADSNIEIFGCEDSKTINKANKLHAMVRSIELLSACYKNRKAIEILKQAQRLCLDCGCGCN
jgi:hypothetical protein